MCVFWDGIVVTLSSNRDLAGVVFDVVCAMHFVPQTICVHSESKLVYIAICFYVRLHL